MKKGWNVTAPVTVWLSEEDITDIMVEALEHGIGYWACLDNRFDMLADAPPDEPVAETAAKILLKGGSLTLLDDEDHSNEWVLTLDKLLNGIGQYISEAGAKAFDGYEGLDIGYIDSVVADMIIQYALFDEIVYG